VAGGEDDDAKGAHRRIFAQPAGVRRSSFVPHRGDKGRTPVGSADELARSLADAAGAMTAGSSADLLERLGVEKPVVQAGMGGGLSRHELAAAVSEAGGLGTIAVNGATAIERELREARKLTGRPLAVNLLLPFARRDWFRAAASADVLVTFWGRPKRRTPGVWLHQCGSVEEARAAHAAGADAAIVQGIEAGGHVRGK